MCRLHMYAEAYVCVCVRVSLSLSLTVYCLYTCAFPNELSNLPKARTLARGSHLNARMRALELTRSNEAGAKVKQTYSERHFARGSDARDALLRLLSRWLCH